jgi:hypothetical protein
LGQLGDGTGDARCCPTARFNISCSFVALALVRDLLFRAKHLFVAAMVAIAAAGGSRMSNGTASALNSEQDLASIPMAQGGLSRLAIALPVAPLCSACGPGMVKKLKL